ncbi:cupin domain-containing protein [Kineothrix sp. MB12-C1]|uniref:cupin domain-containing protein n=1 Tax=Kineothrix sp. MB12-C1 TaxID=3070215 RepID=UPI0027D31D2F|nr:cupin domain-containing protein [Kineothrix sp. MB12-C1]WMC93627.1 cupin domain-containing protein [Kineothrix sp. MB12-C1]
MDFFNSDCCDTYDNIDQGPKPFVTNLRQDTLENTNFRTARWTCKNMQLTLMSVPVDSDIGMDVHDTSDQFFYIERGSALVIMGNCPDCLNYQAHVYENYSILVPAGTWHNVINTGPDKLKMFSIYAPALHPYGTIYETRDEETTYLDL